MDPIVQYRESQLSEIDEDNPISSLQNIELNVVELCNRHCVFCPRADPKVYQNRSLHMSDEVSHCIGKRLEEEKYKYKLSLSGFGEPLLHKNLPKLISIINSYIKKTIGHFEIICNGDFLTDEIICSLYESGIKMIMVNLYDDESQCEKFKLQFDRLKISHNNYLLRPHYSSMGASFGLTLNNRSGMATKIFDPIKFPINSPCFLPFYKMMIDWDGSLLLCSNDWGRKSDVKKNIFSNTLLEMWMSEDMNKYRNNLLMGRRDITPCSSCNINGTLVGENHYKYFKKLLQNAS